MTRAFSVTTSSEKLSAEGKNNKGKVKTLLSEDSNLFLITKYFVYQMCRFPLFVKNCSRITNFVSKILGTF
jgi:hypothetical protein